MHNNLNLTDNFQSLHKTFNLLFWGMGFLFLVSCQTIEKKEKPQNLIPKDKMVEVLIDVHLFNAAKSVNRLPLQQTGMTPHQFIYEKHDIDSLTYEQSNAYYGADLDTYEAIHAKVKAQLEQRKTVVDTTIAQKKRAQDSLKFIQDSIKLQRLNIKSDDPPVIQSIQEINRDSI